MGLTIGEKKPCIIFKIYATVYLVLFRRIAMYEIVHEIHSVAIFNGIPFAFFSKPHSEFNIELVEEMRGNKHIFLR